MGGADRFLEDLGSDIPRNQSFRKVVEVKIVQHVKLGWFKRGAGKEILAGLCVVTMTS